MSMHTLSFRTSNGNTNFQIANGQIALIAGPNGVGKSALLADLYRSLPQGIGTYLPGHRQIYFNNSWETIGQTYTQLIHNLFRNHENFNRYKSAWSEDQFKSTVRTLLHLEAAYNRDFRTNFANGAYESTESGLIKISPVDTVNLVFKGARLPVRFKLSREGLSAQRNGNTYSIEAMSDGERAALYIVCSVVTQPQDSVLLIDEPEKHLHPSITGLLLDTCIRSRDDISIIVASHDISLIEGIVANVALHVKNSEVISTNPERRIYDIDIIENISSISEDLRKDILGSRSEIIFVEGEPTSYDIALYGHVYKDKKIVPKGGHNRVSESVSALRALKADHWLNPQGIVDGDGRNDQEKAALREKGVFALPCPSIENVFFLDEVITCFLEAISSYTGSISNEDRLQKLAQECIAQAKKHQNDIVAQRTSWLLDRRLSEEKISPKQIRDNSRDAINISISDIYNEIEKDVQATIDKNDVKIILQYLPIKNTGLPHAAAQALGAKSFDEYRNVILRQIEIESSTGLNALESIRQFLPTLP